MDPVFACPSDISVTTDVGTCAAVVTFATPTATDNCSLSSVVMIAGLPSGSAFPVGTTTITYRATDVVGNTSDCSFDITVTDNEDPTIACPSAIIVNTDLGLCTASSVNLGTPVTSDNCTGAVITNDAPTTFPEGVTTVTWLITDAAGNTASCQQTVTVRDNQAPTITCPSDVIESADAGSCAATNVMLGLPVTTDNCPGEVVSNDAPASFPVGSTDVTWTVTDAAGNSTTCTQTVTIEDDEVPTITCPAAVTVDADLGSCEASGVALGVPITADNCINTSFTNDAPSSFPVGTTEVTWTVQDAAGNMATCIQQVTVIDNEAPMISCPPSVTVPVGVDCTAPGMNLVGLISDDNCGIDTFFNDAPDMYPLGTTTVTWTVIDIAGNASTCSQDIIALDDTPPMITCPADITGIRW